MLKLLFTLECPEVPALQQLHELILRELGQSGGDIKALSDRILSESRNLTSRKDLSDSKLIISLHKVRSKDWNVLLIKYRDYPNRYQCEIRKEAAQKTLFA